MANRIKIGEQTVKVALEGVHGFIANAANADATVGSLLANPTFINLLVAQRGGGQSSEENWLEVAGVKVGRVCSVLGTYFSHDNENKEASNFYRNGSYHIVIERLKNLKSRHHKATIAIALQTLEDDMMDGVITPKEWKAKKDEALTEFKFEISDDTKQYLINLTQGYETKEALAKAMADEATNTDYSEIEADVDSYLDKVEADMFPKEEETEEETEEA